MLYARAHLIISPLSSHQVIEGRGLLAKDAGGVSDPYCTVELLDRCVCVAISRIRCDRVIVRSRTFRHPAAG
jgi:hypothetical protein